MHSRMVCKLRKLGGGCCLVRMMSPVPPAHWGDPDPEGHTWGAAALPLRPSPGASPKVSPLKP